jgi:hypothetical protein
MDRLDSDPFTLQPRMPHPSLVEQHVPTFDVFEPLFEEFFNSDEFRNWSSGQKQWQLHCHGGPGCGKVNIPPTLIVA